MKSFFTLVAQVIARGDAEHLETCELLSLAESCEAPPEAAEPTPAKITAGRIVRPWSSGFAIPLIRELGRRLAAAGEADKHAELISAVVQMRTAQRGYFKERTRENLRHSKELERRVDKLLEQRSQLELFTE